MVWARALSRLQSVSAVSNSFAPLSASELPLGASRGSFQSKSLSQSSGSGTFRSANGSTSAPCEASSRAEIKDLRRQEREKRLNQRRALIAEEIRPALRTRQIEIELEEGAWSRGEIVDISPVEGLRVTYESSGLMETISANRMMELIRKAAIVFVGRDAEKPVVRVGGAKSAHGDAGTPRRIRGNDSLPDPPLGLTTATLKRLLANSNSCPDVDIVNLKRSKKEMWKVQAICEEIVNQVHDTLP